MPERTTLPTALLAVLLLTVSTNANAQGQYIGGAIDFNGDQNAQAATLSGRYGIRVTRLGAQGLELYGEARVAFGITEASTKISDFDVDVKIGNLIGVYGSLRYPLGSSNFTPYLTLGFTRVGFKGTAASEASVNDSDLSFGGGLDWKLNDKWGLKIDGIRYIENSYGHMTGVSVGVSRWLN